MYEYKNPYNKRPAPVPNAPIAEPTQFPWKFQDL